MLDIFYSWLLWRLDIGSSHFSYRCLSIGQSMTSLTTNDFVRNTGKCADRHLLASHLRHPTEMPSFRGSHSQDTCVPRNQWSVRFSQSGYRRTQDHGHRIWGNRRSSDGRETYVVLRTTDSELCCNGRGRSHSMDPSLRKPVERRFLGRCPKYNLLDTNC